MGTPSSTTIIRPRMPELDSLRGVAILLVVFYHGFFWSNNVTGLTGVGKLFVSATRFGWLGVNLFFVLSGFLITGILLDSKAQEHYFRRFYVRRALRILPAFYGLLLILLFIPSQSRAYLLLSFFYLSNLASPLGIPMTYTMLWSLAVEEHFYFVWPVAVRILSGRALMICAAAIVCVEPFLRAWYFFRGWPEGSGYLTWLVADGLAMGAILAMIVRLPQFTRKRLAMFVVGVLGVATSMALFGARYGILTQRRLLGASLLLTVAQLFFLGALGLTLFLGTGKWPRLVNIPILQFFGEISYGLYLIHWLFFAGYDAIASKLWPSSHPALGEMTLLSLRFICAAGLASIAAFLSRKYFEGPFLRLKNRWTAA
jgi:peptidoglycan/LPS O-acetylase OafA/YrhL